MALAEIDVTPDALPLDSIICGDCLDVLRGLPDACVDAVICDPPYGTTACRWDVVIPLTPLWTELHRIIKPHRAIALFASQPFTSMLIASNIKRFRHEWIWQKTHGGGFLNANRMPLKRHESIVVFGHGAPLYHPQMSDGKPYRCRRAAAGETTFDQSVAGWETVNSGFRYPTSVLTFASETGLHPTQKPVPLLRYLVQTYTNPGDIVLDFAVGSGTTAVAAALEGRRYIGIERDARYVMSARHRLAHVTPASTPPAAAARPTKPAPAKIIRPSLWANL